MQVHGTTLHYGIVRLVSLHCGYVSVTDALAATLPVFLIYDYVITFGREVDLFWTTKLTGASVLFFTNRYVTLLFNALGLVALGHFSDTKVRSLLRKDGSTEG